MGLDKLAKDKSNNVGEPVASCRAGRLTPFRSVSALFADVTERNSPSLTERGAAKILKDLAYSNLHCL